ncbi:MAG: TlpA family protein disulfide reductase, partial [Gammaproteobacteria bacterium]
MDRNAKAVVPGLCCAVVRQLVGQGVFWLAVLLTGAAQAAPKVGEVPPTYVGVDAEGNAVDLFGFKGKVVVVTFWASWCGYCLKEIPVLENVQRQAGDGRIRVIAVNIDD